MLVQALHTTYPVLYSQRQHRDQHSLRGTPSIASTASTNMVPKPSSVDQQVIDHFFADKKNFKLFWLQGGRLPEQLSVITTWPQRWKTWKKWVLYMITLKQT